MTKTGLPSGRFLPTLGLGEIALILVPRQSQETRYDLGRVRCGLGELSRFPPSIKAASHPAIFFKKAGDLPQPQLSIGFTMQVSALHAAL